ncbi:hypothetical protein GCM10023310_72170 [Paenibacillus vulneris]|uniref:Uncharacterized protein n=1 Tax=Paenibacillus vulneris TaxID=1133364 RepID=A0ABW3UFU9_9BACL
MPSPVVSWMDSTNTKQETIWPIGTVDAGSVSSDKTFLIWNNRGGTSAVSDMTTCSITTKDNAGGNTGELVLDKWIEVRVDTMSETTFTKIGGTTTKTIKAGGTSPAATIKGSTNDGTLNALENFAQVTLHAAPLPTATAGNVDFLTRISYTYN